MALVICTECGKQFSNNAPACPKCQCPTSSLYNSLPVKEELNGNFSTEDPYRHCLRCDKPLPLTRLSFIEKYNWSPRLMECFEKKCHYCGYDTYQPLSNLISESSEKWLPSKRDIIAASVFVIFYLLNSVYWFLWFFTASTKSKENFFYRLYGQSTIIEWSRGHVNAFVDSATFFINIIFVLEILLLLICLVGVVKLIQKDITGCPLILITAATLFAIYSNPFFLIFFNLLISCYNQESLYPILEFIKLDFVYTSPIILNVAIWYFISRTVKKFSKSKWGVVPFKVLRRITKTQ